MRSLRRVFQREDLDQSVGLVWAVREQCLPNFLTPRNCLRVAYHVGETTTEQNRIPFFSSPTWSHAVIIEAKWLEAMRRTTRYLYEFDPGNFELQDDIAGYYVSKTAQKPVNRFVLHNLLEELAERNVEIRIVDNLQAAAERVKASTLNWSLCRMAFAQPRP